MNCLFPLVLLTSLVSDTSPLSIHPTENSKNIEIQGQLPASIAKTLPLGILPQSKGEEFLRFSIVDKGNKAGPAIFGAYIRKKSTLIFRPRYPLTPGTKYRATLTLNNKVTTQDHLVPVPKRGPKAIVTKVYPTAAVLPANQLRFYIHFSQPMRGGKDIFDEIYLVDGKGKIVTDPWLREELWDEKDQRLLLYIHPGRIKWGLLMRRLLGPVLLPDREYTLVITTKVLDRHGRSLRKEYRKKFRTDAENRKRLELSDWKLTAPKIGKNNPVQVEFPLPLDHFGMKEFLSITSKGKRIPGKIKISQQERQWMFYPAQPWENKSYQLVVDPQLEDIAGNTPLRAFDVDLTEPQPKPQSLTIPFRPKK